MKRNSKMSFFDLSNLNFSFSNRLSSGNGAKIARKATIELFKKFNANKNMTIWVNRKEGINMKIMKKLIN
jgi:hypothetical protein